MPNIFKINRVTLTETWRNVTYFSCESFSKSSLHCSINSFNFWPTFGWLCDKLSHMQIKIHLLKGYLGIDQMSLIKHHCLNCTRVWTVLKYPKIDENLLTLWIIFLASFIQSLEQISNWKDFPQLFTQASISWKYNFTTISQLDKKDNYSFRFIIC